MRPSLVLLAGPNGAGKSTLYQTRVAPGFAGPFINADLIQRDDLGDASMEASYRAAAIAEERRTKLLEDRKSFATETVSFPIRRSSTFSRPRGSAAISSWSCMSA
uniref:UDP-N-acetylglucosamine kinase n=1 Tax=Cereibacter sphaeroides (strain ATCC 17025 / ATH 2.4.3) TaxID=349102 RepID=A4X044_CERS5